MEIEEEKIEKLKIEMLNYIDEKFEEQSKENTVFFNNVLNLIKAEIRKDNKDLNEELKLILDKMKNQAETNKAITTTLVDELTELDNIFSDENDGKLIYKNLKQGIKQFSIQMGITFAGLLIILGSFYLIKLIF